MIPIISIIVNIVLCAFLWRSWSGVSKLHHENLVIAKKLTSVAGIMKELKGMLELELESSLTVGDADRRELH